MQLNTTTQEVNKWKNKYKEKCQQLKEYQSLDTTMNWKSKYEKITRITTITITNWMLINNQMISSSSGG